MNYLIMHHCFKPKYYDLMGIKKHVIKFIRANHIACFYGVIMARIWSNKTSINNMWSVHEILDAFPSVKECMPQDVCKNLYCCSYELP